VWGLLFVNVFGLNPLTAVLALAIPFGAITAKVFSEILDETPTGALYAALAAGAAPLPALCYTTLPQALPDLLGYTFYRLECAIRSATILGLIGAGGLGYQLLLSLQSLRYQEMWTFLYALILLCGITDLWSSRLRWKLNVADESVICRVGGDGRLRPEGADWPVRLSVVAVVLLTVAAVFYVQADWSLLFAPRSWRNLWGIAGDLLPPRLEPALLLSLMRLSVDTVAMALLAMVVAGAGGALLAFPAAVPPAGGRKKPRFLHLAPALITRGLLLVARSVPEPVWALLALLVFFPGVLPGAIGLGLYNLGILGRLKAEAIENLDERPSNSLRALGASPGHVFFYGVVPRAMPRFIGYTLYRWEVCVRATLVVGLVGAGGLGRLLAEQIASFDYRGMTSTLLAFFVLTVLIDWGSAWARRVWG
jgi:phosphonate transport system permease protein